MRRILKYNIDKGSLLQDIEMPRGADILNFQAQGENLVIWALVDMEYAEVEHRRFKVALTGEYFPGEGKYIGTVQSYLVYHLFEI